MEQAIGNAPYVAPQALLIVDDDAINRGILDNIFSAYYMDGLETLQHLKRLDLLDEVPVFLITAESSDALMREAYKLGVMDVISKPVVPYVVTRRVNSAVELFRARKSLSSQVMKPAVRAAPAGRADHSAQSGDDRGAVHGHRISKRGVRGPCPTHSQHHPTYAGAHRLGRGTDPGEHGTDGHLFPGGGSTRRAGRLEKGTTRRCGHQRGRCAETVCGKRGAFGADAAEVYRGCRLRAAHGGGRRPIC